MQINTFIKRTPFTLGSLMPYRLLDNFYLRTLEEIQILEEKVRAEEKPNLLPHLINHRRFLQEILDRSNNQKSTYLTLIDRVLTRVALELRAEVPAEYLYRVLNACEKAFLSELGLQKDQ